MLYDALKFRRSVSLYYFESRRLWHAVVERSLIDQVCDVEAWVVEADIVVIDQKHLFGSLHDVQVVKIVMADDKFTILWQQKLLPILTFFQNI